MSTRASFAPRHTILIYKTMPETWIASLDIDRHPVNKQPNPLEWLKTCLKHMKVFQSILNAIKCRRCFTLARMCHRAWLFCNNPNMFGQQSKTRGFPDRPSAKNKIMELKPRGMDLRPDPPGLFISPGIAGGYRLVASEWNIVIYMCPKQNTVCVLELAGKPPIKHTASQSLAWIKTWFQLWGELGT